MLSTITVKNIHKNFLSNKIEKFEVEQILDISSCFPPRVDKNGSYFLAETEQQIQKYVTYSELVLLDTTKDNLKIEDFSCDEFEVMLLENIKMFDGTFEDLHRLDDDDKQSEIKELLSTNDITLENVVKLFRKADQATKLAVYRATF